MKETRVRVCEKKILHSAQKYHILNGIKEQVVSEHKIYQ